MKDKVFIFIVGLLIGAILAVSCMLLFEKGQHAKLPDRDEFQMMRPDGERSFEGEPKDGERPELPSGGDMQRERPDRRS